MKELTIQVAILQDSLGKTKNPYWFTRGMSIHVTAEQNVTIDIDTLSHDTLIEIYNGVQLGLIEVSGEIDYLNEKIRHAIFGDETAPALDIPPVEKSAIDLEAQKALKIKTLLKEAAEILGKPQPEVKLFIGSGQLVEEGIIGKGLEDIALLNAMLKSEEENKKRKTVLAMIKERIALIEQYGIKVTPDTDELEIEDVDEKRLRYNETLKTFDELPLETTDGQ